MFARQVAHLVHVSRRQNPGSDTLTYHVSGQLFFASVNDFLGAFDYQPSARNVVIDLSQAHLWDGSAIAAIDKVVLKYRRHGIAATVAGMNEASATLLDRLAIHDKSGALEHVANP